MYALDLIDILHMDENNLGVDRATFCIYTKCSEEESTKESKPDSDSKPGYTPNDFLFQEAIETEASTSTEIPGLASNSILLCFPSVKKLALRANQCPLVGEIIFSFVPPSNSLVSVSDPRRAFWADTAHFKITNKDTVKCASLGTEVPGQCQNSWRKPCWRRTFYTNPWSWKANRIIEVSDGRPGVSSPARRRWGAPAAAPADWARADLANGGRTWERSWVAALAVAGTPPWGGRGRLTCCRALDLTAERRSIEM